MKFLYNLSMFYTLPFFQGPTRHPGTYSGRLDGLPPLFTAQSGLAFHGRKGLIPKAVAEVAEAFGEVTTPGTSGAGSTSEGAVKGLLPYTGNPQTRYNIYPTERH